jgi:hypothetical protein
VKNYDETRKRVDEKKRGFDFILCGEEFVCLPVIPAGAMQRMALSLRLDEKGRQVYNAPDVVGFIEDCLRKREWIPVVNVNGTKAITTTDASVTPADAADDDFLDLSEEQRQTIEDEGGYWEPADDRERFRRLIAEDNTEDLIELPVLAEIMNDISEAAAERPTKRSKR